MARGDQNPLRRYSERGSSYRKPSRGFIGGFVRFTDHCRINKVYPDAEATLEVCGMAGADWLEIELSEEFEISNGQIRTNKISLTLNKANRDALRAVLDEIAASEAK
ncbi:MAG: hypothetical protein AAF376_05115 [Pseudomonadota bacterium]